MKKATSAAYIAAIFFASTLCADAQTRSATTVIQPGAINTTPVGLSQFQVEGRLITQNNFSIPTPTNYSGSFSATARWNSMGNLNAGAQTINGFRTQTNGRALATGYTITNATGALSNPFIQWIGNNSLLPNVAPGNLEFRYATNPGVPGFPAADVRLFTMAPNTATNGGNCYAENGLIGHLNGGVFGNATGTDTWIGSGATSLVTGTFVYGTRTQLKGRQLYSTLCAPNTGGVNAIIGFGDNPSAGIDIDFLSFKYYDNPFVDPGTGGIEMMRMDRKFTNVNIGYNNYSIAIPEARLAVFDGAFPAPSALVTSSGSGGITDGIGVYGISSGIDNPGNSRLRYSAAIVGDVANSAAGGPDVDPNFPTNTYAILGIARNEIKIGPTASRFAGFFIGDVGISGTLYTPSDRKLKEKIATEEGMLDKIMKLNPVHYEYKSGNQYKNLALSNQLQHGFISQELEEVFPELVRQVNGPTFNKDVKPEDQSFKGINYMQMIPVLTKAIQELNTKVQALESQLQDAKAEAVSAKKAGDATAAAEIAKNYTLTQNVPNPFSQNTTITYSVPENTRQALLAIFDLNGKMIKQYNLEQGRNRQQVVSANTLKPGMYIYTLLADGVEMVSKKMIVTE